ncbi:RNA-binding protein [Phaeovibrio sulfidiphilus]|uniref:RNA-binding protein n=1 Tax=Phaeovibrio sulfidiphilus TaxID=1220600 RepID=A0A8J6YNU1_9PROT|nr:RNA-binding protein [Phaeovibrio sulfidiphilus]
MPPIDSPLPAGPAEDSGEPDLSTPEPDGPSRRCILSRSVRPKEAMLRFVVSPDRVVTPDVDGRLPGRGFWLSPAPDVIETARRKGVFPKAARCSLTVPEDLAERVDALLEERCLRLVGLARKAGQAVVGYEKVRGVLQKGGAAFVIEAFDAAENARKKLNAAQFGVPVFRPLDREALARAFARDNAVHAAVMPGGLASGLAIDLERLSRMRGRISPENALEKAVSDLRRPGVRVPRPGRREAET